VGSYEATWKDKEAVWEAMRLPGKIRKLCGKL
jgi:hypothetical protein